MTNEEKQHWYGKPKSNWITRSIKKLAIYNEIPNTSQCSLEDQNNLICAKSNSESVSSSVMSDSATPWTIACQGPLFMEFFRQEYWSGLPCPPPDPGIEPTSFMSPTLAGRFFTTSARNFPRKPLLITQQDNRARAPSKKNGTSSWF